MNALLLLGSENSPEMDEVLLTSIQSIGASVLNITDNSISMLPACGEQADYVLIKNANLTDLRVSKGIVIFNGPMRANRKIKIPDTFIAVVDPNNLTALDFLKKQALQTVSCGLSQKDTFTFSSLDVSEAVVSLQREIKSITGEKIEPCEIPVQLSASHSEYSILTAIAVLRMTNAALPQTILL